MRPSRRQPDELRAISLERGVVKYAEGSCFVKFGDTHVLVTATLEDRLPPWLKGQARGWVTAEYGMLPRATNERTRRERSEEHTSELQSQSNLVCRLLLEKKKKKKSRVIIKKNTIKRNRFGQIYHIKGRGRLDMHGSVHLYKIANRQQQRQQHFYKVLEH